MKKFTRTVASESKNFLIFSWNFLGVFTRDSDRKTRLSQVSCLLDTKTAYRQQNKKNEFCHRFSLSVLLWREEFLDKIVTGDETWVPYVNLETKQQAVYRGHTASSSKWKKLYQRLSARKIMATVFWDAKGILLADFMEHGMIITSAACWHFEKTEKSDSKQAVWPSHTWCCVWAWWHLPSHCSKNKWTLIKFK